MLSLPHRILSAVLVAMLFQPLSAATLHVTHGGTYSGKYDADGKDKPAVRIATDQPVTLENCDLGGEGPAIIVESEHAKLRLLRIRATRNPSTRPGETVGRFLTVQKPDSLEVAGCRLNRTAGIYILSFGRYSKLGPTIWIHDNIVHNVDGRIAGKSQPAIVQFVQLDKVRQIPFIDISWNQVVNDPGDSAVEDVISIYKSSGIPGRPIRIHDNGIRGAYPVDPGATGYSGGGIMLGDGGEKLEVDGPAYVEAFGNVVLDTTNYGIAVSAGHHCMLHDNRIVSVGVLPNRAVPKSQNVGAYIWDANRNEFPNKNFHDNGGRDNIIGWAHDAGRNDWWTPDAAFWEGNRHVPGKITPRTINDEINRWKVKLAAHQADAKAK